MYYYTLSCPHSAILATVIMSEEQNSRLLRKISRLFLRIRKWFLNRPETVSSMNNIITQWTHFYSIFFRQMNVSFFPNPWMSLPLAKMLRLKKKFFLQKYGFDSIYDAKCKKIHIAPCMLVQILKAFAQKMLLGHEFFCHIKS